MKKRLLALLICIVMTCGVFSAAILLVAATDTEVLPGDFNGDGKVDISDLVCLRQYFADYDYDTETAPFDMPEGVDTNGDNEITLKDIFFLRKFFTEVSITEQPDAFNKYTVTATGDVSYAWHVWADGEIGEAVEGANAATLTGATNGLCYVCVVSYGELSRVSDPVIYMTHPICGEICECEGETHESLNWKPLLTLDEFKKAMEIGGNYYLAADVTVDQTVYVRSNVNLCLSGKKLTRVAEGDFSIINVAADVALTLTDCSDEERVGYIDPISGLWTEGVYSGEGSATEYNLYGGVITGGNSDHGGAIYVSGALELYGVNIAGNSANKNGGAIYLVGASMTAKGDNVFVGNTAENHAGAIYVTYVTDGADGILTMTGGVFAHNTAMAGGAVSSRTGCVSTFVGTVFVSNKATGTENNQGGGAIYTNNNALTLSGVTLDGNSSAYYGGAISGLAATVEIKGGTVITNSQGGTGAALYFRENGTKVTITNSTVSNNTASVNGVIYMTQSGELTVNGLVAEGNTANNGGVFYVSGGTSILNNVTASGNTAESNGGVIYVVTANMTVNGSSFSGNTSGNGGAIFATKNAKLTVLGASFTENGAKFGGVIFIEGAIVEIGSDGEGNKTLFESNTVKNYGGAIYINDYSFTPEETEEEPNPETEIVKSTVTLNGAILKNSTATRGGAIYVANNEYTIINAEFINNSATDTNYGGGAIYSTNSVGYLDAVAFVGNTSHKGGAVALHSGSKMTVTSMTATENSATLNSADDLGLGGVFYVNNSTLNLVADEGKNITFGGSLEGDANTAVNGGAICAENGSTLNINNATFEGNSAKTHGGAIYSKASAVTVTGDNTLFKNNSAVTHGGAIYATYSGDVYTTIEMTDGRFEGNTAMGGGAVSIRSNCSATFTRTVFTGNSVTGDDGTADGNGEGGGAIYNGYGKLTLVDVEMTGNTASVYGGAISAVGGTVTAKGGEFKENTAGRGGAIHSIVNTTMSFTETKFTSNEATEYKDTNKGIDGGGAINIEEGRLTLSGVVMDGNTSAYYGGAINARKGTVEIKDGTVITNSKGKTGAALYFREKGTTVTITDSTVSNNTSSANGVIYMTSAGTLTVDGLTASGNKAVKGGVFYVSGGTHTFSNVDATNNDATAENGGDILYASGSAEVTINYKTEEEKTSWENGTYNAATVTYVPVSDN